MTARKKRLGLALTALLTVCVIGPTDASAWQGGDCRAVYGGAAYTMPTTSMANSHAFSNGLHSQAFANAFSAGPAGHSSAFSSAASSPVGSHAFSSSMSIGPNGVSASFSGSMSVGGQSVSFADSFSHGVR